jgi:hypothetical protein
MNAVPEEITSADVIVWSEGSTFAQRIAAGRHRLKGDEPESVGALIPDHPLTTSFSNSITACCPVFSWRAVLAVP